MRSPCCAQPARPGLHRGAPGICLHASAPPARAACAAAAHDHVPDLPGCSPAHPGLAVEDDAAPHARAPEDAQQRRVVAARAQGRLGLGCDLDVVCDRDRHAQRRPELRPERERAFQSRMLTTFETVPASVSIVARRADAHACERTRVGAGSRGRLAQHVCHRGDDARAGRRRMASAHARLPARLPSGSTTTAWIFVPPRSMPPRMLIARTLNDAAQWCPARALVGSADEQERSRPDRRRRTCSRSRRRATRRAASRAIVSRLAQVPGLRFARLVFAGARRWEAMSLGLDRPAPAAGHVRVGGGGRARPISRAVADRARVARADGPALRGAHGPVSHARHLPGSRAARRPACAGRPGGAGRDADVREHPHARARLLLPRDPPVDRAAARVRRPDRGGRRAGAVGPRRHDVHHLGLTARRARILLPPRTAPRRSCRACASTSG